MSRQTAGPVPGAAAAGVVAAVVVGPAVVAVGWGGGHWHCAIARRPAGRSGVAPLCSVSDRLASCTNHICAYGYGIMRHLAAPL
jgi:hypothetical protein